ncbi:hypothetical protein DFH09DRAFT_1290469 [Mycena vulgaris]|nr:hypothetical protein DFH09DRAFT_1290469 [Mycena vulgaris]
MTAIGFHRAVDEPNVQQSHSETCACNYMEGPKGPFLATDEESNEPMVDFDLSDLSDEHTYFSSAVYWVYPLEANMDVESDTFLDDFFKRPETVLKRSKTAFVDKTQCILWLPEKFQCILLRPPRFGKSTFLSTLDSYIRGAKHFTLWIPRDRHRGS